MALEITTVGAKVLYAVEETAGTRPTSSFTALADVNTAPEITLDTDALDCSNIGDTITRYTPGRQDPGGNKSLTLNHTEAAITAWDALVSAATTARAAGKACWFEYQFSGASKSFFFSVIPQVLGSNGIEQNSVDTIPAPFIVNGVEGWAAKSV